MSTVSVIIAIFSGIYVAMVEATGLESFQLIVLVAWLIITARGRSDVNTQNVSPCTTAPSQNNTDLTTPLNAASDAELSLP